VLSLYITRNKI